MSKYDLSRFKNVTVAFNTPFDKDGELDVKAAKQLSRYYQKLGIKSLYLCGSTGEGFLLSQEERKQLTETVVEEVGNEMTIIIHVGTACTRHSSDLARHAAAAGAHATSAVPSVYYRPGEEGIYRHWTEITEAADLPFFIYNNPQLTGYSLSMPLFYRMLKNERVAGVKNTSESAQDILRYKQAGGKDFIVFNGPDEQYLAGRVIGADAGIGGTYGTMPELYLKLEELIRANDMKTALELQTVITSLIYRLIDMPSMFGASKAILKLRGVDAGIPRLPFLPVSSEDPKLIALYNDILSAVERFCS